MAEKLTTWWNSLAARERVAVLVGSMGVLLVLLYLVLWMPLARNTTALHNRIGQQQQDLAWMQTAAKRIKQLQQTPAHSGGRGSLLSIVEKTLTDNGLKTSLQRMEPDGANKVKVWLNRSNFDQFIRFIGRLEQAHGINITSASLVPSQSGGRSSDAERNGLIDAKITLVRGNG